MTDFINSTVVAVPKINTRCVKLILVRHAHFSTASSQDGNSQYTFDTTNPYYNNELMPQELRQINDITLTSHIPDNENVMSVSSSLRRCILTKIRIDINLRVRGCKIISYNDFRIDQPKKIFDSIFVSETSEMGEAIFVSETSEMASPIFSETKRSFGDCDTFKSVFDRVASALQDAFDAAFANECKYLLVIGHYNTIQYIWNLIEGRLPFIDRDIPTYVPIIANIVECPSYWILNPEVKTKKFSITLQATNEKDAQTEYNDVLRQIISAVQTKTRKIMGQVIFSNGKYYLVAMLTKLYRFHDVDHKSFDAFINETKNIFPTVSFTVPKLKSALFATLGSYIKFDGAYVENINEIEYPGLKKNGWIRAVWLNKDEETWGYYPAENISAEPAWNGFCPIQRFSDLLKTSIHNKQECFSVMDEHEATYTICTNEERAFNESK